ncbi:MAG: hypothetical protein B5M56_07265 [Desulfococcus sp. 4484_241]|nr:MAG: hypothetical protein B5M56_07265 [Desulfococcus sp. 4484_241]
MIFHTAGIETAPWVPPVVAFVISFFTSMGGVSGAFLLLPFQVSFLGYTAPSVSATNQLFNIVAIPGGVYRYWREGRMVWPLAWIVVAGTLPGVLVGSFLRVEYLPDPRNFKLFAAAVLLYIGAMMLRDLTKKQSGMSAAKRSETLFRNQKQEDDRCPEDRVVTVTHFSLMRLCYTFYGERFDVPTLGVFLLGFTVGIVGGVYGIGGGSIMAPFFVTVLGLPVYTVAGAALMGTLATSVAGVAFYQAIAPFYPHMSVAPDWLLGLLFGIGGTAGIYLGARCQKFVPARTIKWMLSGIIIFTALKYIYAFLK